MIKEIALAASFVAVCSGQLYACALTVSEIENHNQSVSTMRGPIHIVPEDVLHLILTEASKGTRPDTFSLVCNPWKKIMDKDSKPNEEGIMKRQGLFMQLCKEMWDQWVVIERFMNGILKFKSPENGTEQLLKFADFGSSRKGTFDISKFGNLAEFLVITTDPERFFEIGGQNQSKVVTLIALYQDIEQGINSSAQPLKSIMANWDPLKSPVAILWRFGDEMDLAWFDCLITASLSDISAVNLYDNWSKSKEFPVGMPWAASNGYIDTSNQVSVDFR